MVDLKENGKSVSVEPTLLRISDKLILRYVKLGNGPPLVLLHTIRTHSVNGGVKAGHRGGAKPGQCSAWT